MKTIYDKKEEGLYPSYMNLYKSGELGLRVRRALDLLGECRMCPCDCRVDRINTSGGVCNTGRYAVVSGAYPHFGEEDCLRGINGSGAIYFSNCNMNCVFCLNREHSSAADGGLIARPNILANMMLDLQAKGCHNVNFITSEHVIPQMLEALEIAVSRGFSLPLIYNSSSYNSAESLKLLDGVVDIYAADFKFWNAEAAEKYLKVKDYPDIAKKSLKIMHEQVGDLVLDKEGLAHRGLLIRHLIMPDHGDEVQNIMEFIVSDLSDRTYVNLLNQYHPSGDVSESSYPELNRKLNFDEYDRVLEIAKNAGIKRIAHKQSIFSIIDNAGS